MAVKWVFPSNNDAEVKGFNDSGIATFNSKAYSSLAREICQNSLDAGLPEKVVKIEFSKFDLPTFEFPDLLNFKDAIERCIKQSDLLVEDKKPRDFFKKSLEILAKDTIPFLRISDYNTTGLTGSDKTYNSNWINLVKATGSSDKSEQAGGSFGIGKAAPFVCSSLRTVFYSTLDQNNLEATQGIAKLISFAQDSNGKMSLGIGYYGNKERLMPITKCISYDKSFVRNSPGTDIYIAGLIEDDDWKSSIIQEILDNYFYAIYKGVLEIIVDDVIIDKNSMKNVIDVHCKNNDTRIYYDVLTSKNTKVFTDDIDGLGDVTLKILIGDIDYSTKKVAMIRKPWMKICDHKPGLQIAYSGVFIVEGNELNSYLRKLENPAHDKWEAGRALDKGSARRNLRKIYDFIKNKIISLIENYAQEKGSLVGADEFFPIEEDGVNINEDFNDKDYLAPMIKDISLKIVDPKSSNREMDDTSNYQKLEREEGELTTGEEVNLDRVNEKGGKSGTSGKDTEGTHEHKDGNEQSYKYKNVKPANVRLFCISKESNLYKIVFSHNQSLNDCSMTINKLDDQGGRHILKIKSAKEGDTTLIVKNNKITSFNIQKNKSVEFTFSVEDNDYFSSEVTIYGSEE